MDMDMDLEPLAATTDERGLGSTASSMRKFFKTDHNTNTPKQVSLFENMNAKVFKGLISMIEKETPKSQRRKQRAALDVTFREQQQQVDAILENLDASNNETVNASEEIKNAPYDPSVHYIPYTMDHIKFLESQYWLKFLRAYELLNAQNFDIFVSQRDEEKMQAIIAQNITNETECKMDLSFLGILPMHALPIPASPERYFAVFNMQRYQKLELPTSNQKNTKRGFSSNQMQIDAGQRQFGAKLCNVCGLLFSANEAEEEQLHKRYHDSLLVLRWIDEDVVIRYREWSKDGRIIRLTQSTATKKLNRLNEIIAIIDMELGFSSYTLPKIFVISFFSSKFIKIFIKFTRKNLKI